MGVAVIRPEELAELAKNRSAMDLIDVRAPVEFREVHVDFARNMSLDQLDVEAVKRARRGSPTNPCTSSVKVEAEVYARATCCARPAWKTC
jgi:hypothetical protein